MSKIKLILIACFCAAFVAGGATGIALRPISGRRPRPPTLEEQLGLTSQQREQMRKIWSGVMGAPGGQRERLEALQKECDAAVAALLTADQKTQYEEVIKAHAEKVASIEAQRRKAVEEAVASTKEILTEPQRKKYEELLSKHRSGPHGPRGRQGGPGGEIQPPPGEPPPGEPRP